jgi:hypothetical protein
VQQRSVTDPLGDHGHELGVRNGIEVLADVGVDDFAIPYSCKKNVK